MTDAKAGRWKPGQSGNPAGRKAGQRHRSTVMLEKLMASDAKTILQAVLTAAAAGDMSAARMILDRVVPVAKDRPIAIDLPDTSTMQGSQEAAGAIVEAVARGHMLPSEGAALSALLEAQRRTIEAGDLERRIAEIERRLNP